MGLSFVLDESCTHLDVHVTWGDYRRERGDRPDDVVDDEADDKPNGQLGRTSWVRYPRETWVRRLNIPAIGRMARIPLSKAQGSSETVVEGFEDPDVVLDGVVHQVNAQRAVSLFLVNRIKNLSYRIGAKMKGGCYRVGSKSCRAIATVLFLHDHAKQDL
jgi:hypothetical protein